MEIAAILPLADAALSFLETAVPHIVQAFQSGDITAQQQQDLMDRFTALQKTNWAFTRPASTGN